MTSLKTIKIQLECSICTEAYKTDDKMTIIEPCNHHFHDDCIQTWFQQKQECPCCRHKILSDFDKSQIIRMCLLNRICLWFENETLYLQVHNKIKDMLSEVNIDGVGFSEGLNLDSRGALLQEADQIREQFIHLLELPPDTNILGHPLIEVYNKKVYQYAPLTHIIRCNPKPVGIIGGIINMGKALMGMDY